MIPVIDTDAVALDPLELVEALRAGHRAGVDGPDRSHLSQPRPDGENGFLVWPDLR